MAWYRLNIDGGPVPPNSAGENCWRVADALSSAVGNSSPACGVEIFLRLPQRRLRGLQVRIGLQRLGDQAVEFAGMEHLPPLAGNVAAACRNSAMRRRQRGRDGRPPAGPPAYSPRPAAPAAAQNPARPRRPTVSAADRRADARHGARTEPQTRRCDAGMRARAGAANPTGDPTGLDQTLTPLPDPRTG